MLSLSKVCAGYDGKKVLHDITFTLPEGENLCILGPNGCGKTTLLRSIAKLIPFSGNITIDGSDTKMMKRREIASRIAVMSQISSVYYSYTVYETVLLGRYQHMKKSFFGTPSSKDKSVVEECLKTTGLLELSTKPIDELSGGQLQRVFLAHTLAQEPEMILLDEPTNHLDMKNQVELITYLNEWSKKEKHTVIGVFHDINLAMRLSGQLLFLKEGRIAGLGRAEDLIQPQFLYDIYNMDVVSFMVESFEKWNHFNHN